MHIVSIHFNICFALSIVYRVGLFALTSEMHRTKYGMSALEWNNACIAVVGKGKGGGKPDLANANIQSAGDSAADIVEKVVNAASAYLKSKGNK